jgi:hypothetical protein
MRKGIEAARRSCFQVALANFERARELNPGFPPIVRLINLVNEFCQQIEAARSSIDAALEQRNRRKALHLARELDRYVEQVKGLLADQEH